MIVQLDFLALPGAAGRRGREVVGAGLIASVGVDIESGCEA